MNKNFTGTLAVIFRLSVNSFANAPINIKPEGGGGRAIHGNLTVVCIPRVGILIGHYAFYLSILQSRREVNHFFLLILTISFSPGGGDFDNFF